MSHYTDFDKNIEYDYEVNGGVVECVRAYVVIDNERRELPDWFVTENDILRIQDEYNEEHPRGRWHNPASVRY